MKSGHDYRGEVRHARKRMWRAWPGAAEAGQFVAKRATYEQWLSTLDTDALQREVAAMRTQSWVASVMVDGDEVYIGAGRDGGLR